MPHCTAMPCRPPACRLPVTDRHRGWPPPPAAAALRVTAALRHAASCCVRCACCVTLRLNVGACLQDAVRLLSSHVAAAVLKLLEVLHTHRQVGEQQGMASGKETMAAGKETGPDRPSAPHCLSFRSWWQICANTRQRRDCHRPPPPHAKATNHPTDRHRPGTQPTLTNSSARWVRVLV